MRKKTLEKRLARLTAKKTSLQERALASQDAAEVRSINEQLADINAEIEETQNELGWYPETCFDEGIEKTIVWYLNHQDWVKNVTSGDYQNYYDSMYKNR